MQTIITVLGANCKQRSTIVDGFAGKSKGGQSHLAAMPANSADPSSPSNGNAYPFVTGQYSTAGWAEIRLDFPAATRIL
jgi:hypothetical protein